MGIHFHVPGCKRKELAQEIGTWLGCETKYLGVPSCAYRVGFATVDKDGNFTVDSAADEETVERLIEHLYDAGFESDDGESTEESRICVSVPENLLPTAAEENLRAIVTSKCGLFKATFGVNTLPIERKDGKVCFPWLRSDASPEEIRAFDRFICALCEMARNAKRVTAKVHPNDNAKYAMRCFLLRLGFIGEEYKETRKILLRNLAGSSAFRSGQRSEAEVCE